MRVSACDWEHGDVDRNRAYSKAASREFSAERADPEESSDNKQNQLTSYQLEHVDWVVGCLCLLLESKKACAGSAARRFFYTKVDFKKSL